MVIPGIRELPPEQALDLARSTVTTARELLRMSEEQFAEAIARYNKAGGEISA